MAKGVNKAIILGSLGNDPEMRYTADGKAIANLSVATNEQWKDKQTGEKKEKTEWHRVSAFGRLAEIMGEYLKKGSQVYIEGKIQTRKWQDQDGKDRYTTEIVAHEMQMVGGRSGAPQDGSQGAPQQQAAPQQQQQATPPQQAAPQQQGGSNFDDFDGDIPF